MKIDRAVEQFLEYKDKVQGRKPSTIDKFQQVLRSLCAFLTETGIVEMEHISNEHLRAWIAHLEAIKSKYENHPKRPTVEEGLSLQTINRHLEHAKIFLRWYSSHAGELACAPAVLEPRKGVENLVSPRDKAVSPEDLGAVMAEAKRRADAAWDDGQHQFTKTDEMLCLRNHAVLELFVCTLMRVSELCALRVSDLDLEKRRLVVVSEKVNTVLAKPFKEETRTALERYLVVRQWYIERRGWTDDAILDRLFVGTRGELTEEGVTAFLRELALAVDVEPFGPHAIRHRGGQYLHDRGVNTPLASKVIGHASERTTAKYYANQDEERVRKLVEEMDLTDPDPPKFREAGVAQIEQRLETLAQLLSVRLDALESSGASSGASSTLEAMNARLDALEAKLDMVLNKLRWVRD